MAHSGDAAWEKRLNISTAMGNYEHSDANHSRYEPTAYAVLGRLAESGLVGRDDVLVDYGCGRGRVSLFMSHATGCRSIGVEYSEPLWRDAVDNLRRYGGRGAASGRVEFAYANAETYSVDGANCFYFFNPFSLSILQSVLGRIMESYYCAPRPMRLMFYYAYDPYVEYLMTCDMLRFEGEIDCRDLFDGGDARERILIFGIG